MSEPSNVTGAGVPLPAKLNAMADIASAYFSNNIVPHDKVTGVISSIGDSVDAFIARHGGILIEGESLPGEQRQAPRVQAAAPETHVEQPQKQAQSGTADDTSSVGPDGEYWPNGQKPACPVKKSVQQEHIICLEDGRRFKSLKRHLGQKYNLTPQQYRDKWHLPADYPMVAPTYSETRSNLAKAMKLGQGGSKNSAKEAPKKGRKKDEAEAEAPAE